MSPVAVITGMQAEAECLETLTRDLPEQHRPYIHCAGPGPDRAAIACREVDKQEIAGVVSFGVAGGLDAALPPGALLLPAAVITTDNGLTETDSEWRREIGATLDSVPPPTLHLGMDVPVTEPKDKARLFQGYKTHALDMESHVVAAYSRSRGVPFLVLRAIADGANDAVPEAALAGLDESGNVVPLQVVKKLVPRPGQLPALLQLARNSKAAMTALKTLPRAAVAALCRMAETVKD